MTVSGIDFGSLDTTPTTRLGLSNCLTAAWASSTSAVCFTTPGEGVEKDAAMTVAAVVGTRTKTFSYDGALPMPIRERGSVSSASECASS